MFVAITTLLLLAGFVTPLLSAPTAIDEDSPWPRVRSANGNTVTLHLPQVERWTSNWFNARAVVGVKPGNAKKETLGVVWIEAHGKVDHSNRLVTLDRMEITKGRFPETTDNGSNALAIVRELFPGGARTVSLDYLITALGFVQAGAQGSRGFKHEAPGVIWETNRTVLILVDGEPVLRPVNGAPLERVVNTPALLVRDPAANKFYLEGVGEWFSAASVKGPWSLVQTPPPAVAALSTNKPDSKSVRAGEGPPKIIVSTTPAELVMTDSLPDFKPIRGTGLQYAADSDSQLFFHSSERTAYLVLSGRWFKAASLQGPWTYVSPRDLPVDFAKIPPGSPQAVVLASVPGTSQAELAVVANSVPTTATVSRKATLQVAYDGEPKFKPIEGTTMTYAVNAQLPVIRTGDHYYAVQDAVWFVGTDAKGPWQVATEVPEEIYTIPPSSPVYYATYARIYDSDEENVEVGYTPGYVGAYEEDGTMVYGTGWYYDPWYGTDYYGWGWTWGYDYVYYPWYQWWVWRPWWNERGGLRAAVIDNIYDRWQSPRVTPHDRIAGTSARTATRQTFSGHPAVYGRFQGTTRAASLNPPASTLALNPYTRPQTPARAGETPRGAQLLSNVRQSPGGGRDLYASPDGNVYMRKSDGWYRQQAGGKWGYFAPTQGGQVERGNVGAGRGQTASGGASPRIAANPQAQAARNQARGERVPNAGTEAHAREVADLERQYYARALGQMRTQNVHPAARAARGGGRRR